MLDNSKFKIHNSTLERSDFVDLVAVQAYMSLPDYFSEYAFIRKIESLFEKIGEARGQKGETENVPALVVFPEYLGTFLGLSGFGYWVSGAQTTDEAMEQVGKKILTQVIWNALRYRCTLTKAFMLARSYEMYRIYYSTFSRMSREHKMFVVAGSCLLPENKYGMNLRFVPKDARIYNTSLTFDSRGECINITRKVNLVPTQEDVLQLSPGRKADLKPIETTFGKVGNLICYDGFNESHTGEEMFVTLGDYYDSLGVYILTQPSANPWLWEEPWVFNEPGEKLIRKEQWLCEGLYEQMKHLKNVRYGVNPLLIAKIFEHPFDGKSYIFERTPEGQVNILREAKQGSISPQSEEILCVRVPNPVQRGAGE